MKNIRIVSPAKSIDSRHIDFAAKWLKNKGFVVTIGAHAKGEFNYFSGTDAKRLSDMQEAIDDSSVDVILCSRGGYGSVRIIDQLNWSKFEKHPKLICGYSDITVFHNRMNRMNFPSLHCTAPLNFEENSQDSLSSFVNILQNKENQYRITAHELNRKGSVEAEVVGGNLAILATLCATNDDLNTKGKTLFIEDIGEAVYAIDRMLYQLKKSGKLNNLKGLIVGGMTAMKDSAVPFGKSVEQVIIEAVQEYNFPVCFNFPAGHINDNRAIILGQKARLEVNDHGSVFTQTFDGF